MNSMVKGGALPNEEARKKEEEEEEGQKPKNEKTISLSRTQDDDARGAVADLLVLRPRELDDGLVFFLCVVVERI